jgi:hypothetical protein
MKILLTLVLGLALMACDKKKDESPVEPTPTPVVQPSPTPVVDSCPEKASGMYTCYDWKPCNGLFPKYEDALQALEVNDAGGCGKIDSVVVKGGFGPCAECFSVKADGTVTPALHTFEEILKLRASLKEQGVQVYIQKD